MIENGNNSKSESASLSTKCLFFDTPSRTWKGYCEFDTPSWSPSKIAKLGRVWVPKQNARPTTTTGSYWHHIEF